MRLSPAGGGCRGRIPASPHKHRLGLSQGQHSGGRGGGAGLIWTADARGPVQGWLGPGALRSDLSVPLVPTARASMCPPVL